MKLSDFDYNLPKELIAINPVSPRDCSRLLVLDKENGEIKDKKFFDIIDYLEKGDVLVLNNSKVISARLIGKKETGGKVEVFLHKKNKNNIWQCMIGGRKIKKDLIVLFDKNLIGKVLKNNKDKTWDIEFNLKGKEFDVLIEEIGEVPLPPYITKQRDSSVITQNDKCCYQTVYADSDKKGSVAAPTAGLHFTPELLRKIKAKGVNIEYITLHVGLGTFAPVKVDNIKEHKMHSEYVEVKKGVIEKINKAKSNGKKIITVGTTSTRTLEAIYSDISRISNLKSEIYKTWVDIFIYPGYEFKIVDVMITNFHLPKSTLLMLVSAMVGKENINKAYKHAILEKYRFYSYGDAMLIK
ncbi:tRNA preQ1(34) S-adenosylmethionine ribosyltransferase-isomerase QueA [Candidatus Parcubacteria bacterium]|nr:tRNA preQ1(34) S-adenosylmethionine ribosyltransferase-isomerase QueA [Candidatus Parcubacteria bacterium]